MGWVISGLGAVAVMVALRDIFHTLWHPSGFGSLARAVFRFVWRSAKRLLPRRTRPVAGPLAVVATVALWTALMVAGFALVYWPHMPEAFFFGSSLRPEESSDLLASVYLSMVTLATLGFGDIIPGDPVLRLLAPLQALLGFVLLTAAISWVLQIYPALGRRRSVSRRLSMLYSQGATEVLETGDPVVASRLLETITEGVIQVETDLLQYAESYYFTEVQRGLSLSVTLPYALEMAESGRRSRSREVLLASDVLAEAVDVLAGRLDSEYLRTGATTREVLEAYAADHGQDALTVRP